MRGFNTAGNIIYLILGSLFVLFGLGMLVSGLVTPDGGNILYGIVLLLIGAARIFWSISRMRAVSRVAAAQKSQRMNGYNPYMQQPGMYPPPGAYPQQPGAYPPQPGQYGSYGAPGGPNAPASGYPPQYPQQYPPQPGQYTQQPGQYQPQQDQYPPQYPPQYPQQ